MNTPSGSGSKDLFLQLPLPLGVFMQYRLDLGALPLTFGVFIA